MFFAAGIFYSTFTILCAPFENILKRYPISENPSTTFSGRDLNDVPSIEGGN